MVTISDVSKHAGVSRSTVSRLVAGNGYVSEAKRQAIEEAIAALGYRPNALAQALRSNRSNMIGAVVVDIGTPYFANVIYGMQRAARAGGKSLMASSGYADQDEEARAVIELVDRSCDGLVLFLERPMRPDAVEIVRRAQIPVVSIGRDHSSLANGTVVLNNSDGAREAMLHLLKQGHRDIVHLSGQVDFGDTVSRLEGISAALAEYGLGTSDIHVVNGNFSEEFGHSATRALLEEGRAFTAIFAGSDDIAAGVLLALREGGRRVPDEVSVIGFDDAFHARHMWPPLTTVRQPIKDIGEAAAGLLLSFIARPDSPRAQTIVETNLVVRSSVGAPLQERQVA
jgi:LacI family transcriptional regulator